MGNDFNPYAPPQSTVDADPAAATRVYREGKLVRMEVDGLLPDRCIRCNEPAGGYRIERTLYWRPRWWRTALWVSVPGVFVIGLVVPMAFVLFWPIVLILAIADAFVRRKIVVECGLCKGHRNLRLGVNVAFALSWAAIIGLIAAGALRLRVVEHWWFWILVLAMFVLAVTSGLLYRLRLAQLNEERMWLRGTGRTFYEALPSASE